MSSLGLLKSLVPEETSAGSDMDTTQSAGLDDLDQLVRSVIQEAHDATDLTTEDQDTSQASSIAKKKVMRKKRQHRHREAAVRETEAERQTDAERSNSSRKTDAERSNSSRKTDAERSNSSRKNHNVNGLMNGHSEEKNRTKNHEAVSDQEPHSNRKRGHGPPPRKLDRRVQLKPFRSLEISPTAFIDERIQQKYREIAELLSGQFEKKKMSLTRDQLRQMELLQHRYAQAGHGMTNGNLLVPHSMPTQIRKEGLLSNGCKHQDNYGSPLYDDDDDAYTTIRIIQTVETAEDRRPPPGRRRPFSAQHRLPRHHATDSEDEGMRGRNRRRPMSAIHQSRSKSNDGGSATRQSRSRRRNSESEREGSSRERDQSSESSTPRKPAVFSDHHLKNTDNPDLKQWLIQKNREYRRKQKEERLERKESKKKKKQEEEEKMKRLEESEKRVKEWQEKKRKEAIKRAKEEKKQQKEAEKELEAQKSQHALGVVSGKKIDGSSPTPAAQNDGTGGTSGKIRVEGVYPPPTKFVYKRPVSGRIRFMKKTPRSKSPEKAAESSPAENEKKMRMSYDSWLLQKRQKLEQEKKARIAKERELAKSEPDLSKSPRASSRAMFRNKSSERDPDGGPDSALSVTRASLSQRPSSARPISSIPSPLHSKSPRRPLSAKPRVRTSESSETSTAASSFKLPFPPESGVPKHVQRMQQKIFSPTAFQSSQETTQQDPSRADKEDKGPDQTEPSKTSALPDAFQYAPKNRNLQNVPEAQLKATQPDSSRPDREDKDPNQTEPSTKQSAVPGAFEYTPKDRNLQTGDSNQAEMEAAPNAFQNSPESRDSNQMTLETEPKPSQSESGQAQLETVPKAFQYTPKSRDAEDGSDTRSQSNSQIIPDAFKYQSKCREAEQKDSASDQTGLAIPPAFEYTPRSRSPVPSGAREREEERRDSTSNLSKESEDEDTKTPTSPTKRVSFSEHATIHEAPPQEEPFCEEEPDVIGTNAGCVEPPLLMTHDEDEEEEDDYNDDDDWNTPENQLAADDFESFREEEEDDEF